MTKNDGRSYTANFRFQAVLEALGSGKAYAGVERAYHGHPITLSSRLCLEKFRSAAGKWFEFMGKIRGL